MDEGLARFLLFLLSLWILFLAIKGLFDPHVAAWKKRLALTAVVAGGILLAMGFHDFGKYLLAGGPILLAINAEDAGSGGGGDGTGCGGGDGGGA
ncbi:hypothetical protein [Halomonas stenophila]|uniref:Uncharacterized protein n=1 Tax=Halomonas stenophila TaxID=795312 RepID=A0A7W5EY11_9GAMM|nr:hypothetical protein [Halomonas stenophila]MBB3232801.1 hypothetical protein [Halomonas stenophila]